MFDFSQILQRITIAEILEDRGINTFRKRIPCPVHNGKNPTAFSFSGESFNCFSCGAKGGLIDLVMLLDRCDRREAILYLSRRTGVDINTNSCSTGNRRPPVRPRKYSADLEELKSKLFDVEIRRDMYCSLLRIDLKSMRQGCLSLPDYYAKSQIIEHKLDYWDSEAIRLTQLVHSLQKDLRR